ncbi:50S ribosomal protein L24 [archaeon]|nr:50S ribosomal protein L24 [archaeon]
MKKQFSKEWNSSKQPRKQRKYIANAPLHIQRKFISSHLSKELRTKYQRRSIKIRTGDRVKLMRGQFKNKTGKIEKINTKQRKIFIENIHNLKKDGTKVPYPIHPSNLLVLELDLTDKKRQKLLEKKNDKKTHKKVSSAKDMADTKKKN